MAARRAESLTARLPRMLAYPLQSPTVWLLVAIALLRLLAHLPNVLGLLFEIGFWVMAFKLAVEALANTMQGRYEPVSTGDVMATDGEAWDQLVLQVLSGIAVTLVGQFVGPLAGLAALAIVVFALPAAVIMLAVDGSVLHALNPLSWLELARRLGGAYFGVVGVVAGLTLLSALVEAGLDAALPAGIGQVPASFVAAYSLVVVYHVLGDLLHRHHAVLGLDVAPAIARATYANPFEDEAMAAADALARDGRHAEAADRLQDLFRGRGASDAVHEGYRQHLIAAGDIARLAHHDAGHVVALLSSGNEKRALAIVVDTMAREPAFRIEHDESVVRLVAYALRTGQTRLAITLADGFEQRFPRSDWLPRLAVETAWPMADRLGLETAAIARLRGALAAHPSHPEAPALRKQLERIQALPTG